MKQIFLLLLFSCLLGGYALAQSGRFALAPLPYPSHALEPSISRQTMELHHGKHLAAYINNVNHAISGTSLEKLPLEDIYRTTTGSLQENAGQVLNHRLYFEQFSPQGGGEPSGALAEAICKQWNTFADFKLEFERRAINLFGSGWTWLAMQEDSTLVIVQEPNGHNPIRHGYIPLLGFDVWEHAYYLDYQNRRAEHIAALWNIVDWREIERRLK
jgi:Fe-Mn family superoxide dismutase